MICNREGCTRAVPKGRHSYCSPECAHEQNRTNARIRGRELYAAKEARRRALRPQVKMRVCLGLNCKRKGRPFRSTGPGNRFCRACWAKQR